MFVGILDKIQKCVYWNIMKPEKVLHEKSRWVENNVDFQNCNIHVKCSPTKFLDLMQQKLFELNVTDFNNRRMVQPLSSSDLFQISNIKRKYLNMKFVTGRDFEDHETSSKVSISYRGNGPVWPNGLFLILIKISSASIVKLWVWVRDLNLLGMLWPKLINIYFE